MLLILKSKTDQKGLREQEEQKEDRNIMHWYPKYPFGRYHSSYSMVQNRSANNATLQADIQNFEELTVS